MLALVSALAACGGSGGGTTSDGNPTPDVEDMDGSGVSVGIYSELTDTTDGAVSSLRALAVDNTQTIAAPMTGTLNHGPGSVSGGALAGVLNGTRTEIDLDGGGTVTLSNPASTEYMRFFQTSGTGADLFGVVGSTTLLADLPTTDSATYNGFVVMDVAADEGLYTLTGDARITVNWGNNVQTRLNDFAGELNGGSTQDVSGSVTMTGANLNGTSFTGGVLSTTGALFALDGTEVSNQSGQFFGKNADEVGGVLTVASDGLNISAIFAAE
jgi:hypothetical protein